MLDTIHSNITSKIAIVLYKDINPVPRSLLTMTLYVNIASRVSETWAATKTSQPQLNKINWYPTLAGTKKYIYVNIFLSFIC